MPRHYVDTPTLPPTYHPGRLRVCGLTATKGVGSAVISLVNAGLEGFARAVALEAPLGIRVNVVSPPWVTETLEALKMDPSHGKPVVEVAQPM